MRTSFAVQMLISAFLGYMANVIYSLILGGKFGSISLSLTMVGIFLGGKLFGELTDWLDGVSKETPPPSTDYKTKDEQ